MQEQTTEQMEQQVYHRASQELDAFLNALKDKTPEQIINRAYEICTKQDLLTILENDEFTQSVWQVLCKLEHPLDAVYQHWLCCDDSRMSELRDTVADYAAKRQKG